MPVGQKYVPKMEPGKWETWTTTCVTPPLFGFEPHPYLTLLAPPLPILPLCARKHQTPQAERKPRRSGTWTCSLLRSWPQKGEAGNRGFHGVNVLVSWVGAILRDQTSLTAFSCVKIAHEHKNGLCENPKDRRCENQHGSPKRTPKFERSLLLGQFLLRGGRGGGGEGARGVV